MNNTSYINTNSVGINSLSSRFLDYNQNNNIIRKKAESLSYYSFIVHELKNVQSNLLDPEDETFGEIIDDLTNNENISLEFRNIVFGELHSIDITYAEIKHIVSKCMHSLEDMLKEISINSYNPENLNLDELNIKLGKWLVEQSNTENYTNFVKHINSNIC